MIWKCIIKEKTSEYPKLSELNLFRNKKINPTNTFDQIADFSINVNRKSRLNKYNRI